MNGLDTLTAGLFDYAGLFPPAALDLQDALREAARAPRLRRPRLVGADLVVPLDRLGEITRHGLYFNGFGDTTCTLAVVGVERKGLAAAARAVRDHDRSHAPWSKVVALEVQGDAFPAQALNTLRAAQRGLGGIRLFLEPRWSGARWREGQGQLLALLEKLRDTQGLPSVGVKVRCAGPTAVRRATLEKLLPPLVAARIPLKATQGLHHALPTGQELGFLPLAMAVRLLQAHGGGFAAKDLAALLRETDPAQFAFEDGVQWRGFGIQAATLKAAMAELPFTIGSCSLQEPDEELTRLFG
ncbi:MAG TPA: hypothetical protein VHI93_05815 [Candidatus Thermoplasmatota archaeon]|nr:hypothetical protein [Candidatus Thermoplasmatota archaeon]